MTKPMVFCDGVDIYEENEQSKKREKQLEAYHTYGYGAFLRLKTSAERRGITFLLTPGELQRWWRETKDVCSYCGTTISDYKVFAKLLKTNYGKTKWKMFKDVFKGPTDKMTVDRIDNKAGYKLSNITKACYLCNTIKSSTYIAEEMRQFMPMITKEAKENILWIKKAYE